MRLNDLLDRVRPAGAPGASAEGETHHAEDVAQRELTEVAAALDQFAVEAEEIVAAARADVVEIEQDAERRVQQIRAGRADRLARASTSVPERSDGDDDDDDDPQRILNASRAEVERERARAKQEIPRLANAAVEVIWSDVFAQPIGRGTP